MAKYLDYTGLKHYDEKIKSIISTEVDARKAADTVINTDIENLSKGKVDRVTATKTQPRIYGVAGSSTTDTMYDLYVDAQGNSIPLRDANGALFAAAGTGDRNVVNYKQLTDLLLNYLLKSGGSITGDLTIQGDLTVKGSTVTENTESLNVKDAIIITNSDGTELGSTLAGFVIRLNATDCYGIIYDKSSDSVKLGLGKITDGKFAFNTGEGEAVATRADSTALTNGHLIQWDGTNFKLVDSGKSISDIMAAISSVESSVDTVSEAAENARLMAKGAQEAADAAQSSANAAQSAANAAQGTADTALSEAGTKLDKYTSTVSAYDVAYIKKGGDGDNQGWVAITSDAEKDTLVKRDSSGRFKVVAGIEETDAVNYTQYREALGTADTAMITARNKQDKLVSGTNIKTINNQSVLGSGNIEISAPTYTAGDNIDISNGSISVKINKNLDFSTYHPIFDGTGNNDEIAYIGYENGGYTIYGPQKNNATGNCYFPNKTGTFTLATTDDVAKKQDTLVSGTNIKTVNGSSILGSGDLAITTISDDEIDALFA